MRVGVIGGGAAGTSVLDALVRRHDGRRPIEVTVFEADKQYGPGRAYQADSSAALVNQPARHMSLRHDQPDHFLAWYRARAPLPADPDFYVPRTLFGEYLESSFHQAVEDGAAVSVRVRTVGERVVALFRSGAGFLARTPAGEEHPLDAAFLCTGSSEPVDSYGLAGLPGFLPDPYPLRTVADTIRPDAAVSVLGTGLSAVDLVLELARRDHRGPLRMVSRNGLLPGVRNPAVSVPTLVATPSEIRALAARPGGLTVAALGDLVARELAAHGLDPAAVLRACRVEAQPYDRLRRHLDAAERGERWQAVLAQITGDSQIEDAWSLLAEPDRRHFQRDWHAMAVSLWSPMPLDSARTLAELVEAGRLEILRGVRSAAPHPDRAGFLLQGEEFTHAADHVVNTVRPLSAAVPLRAVELMDSLVAGGLARPHRFGGLRIDLATNRVLAPDGTPTPGLYALGQPAVGELHAATSNLSMISRRAAQSVAGLLGR
ncbi:FAD/NAD(P)-binding protein [Kitasatospora sp. NPDC002543]